MRAVLFILLLAVSPVLAYYHHSSKIAWQEYSSEAFKKAERENKPVLLYVTASWCFWCRAFERDVLESEEVAALINRSYVAIFLDYDVRRDIAEKYQQGLPTNVILTPRREVIMAFPGYVPRESYLRVLEAALQVNLTAGKKQEQAQEVFGVEVERDMLLGYIKDYDALLELSFDSLFGGFSRYAGMVTWEEKYRFPQPFLLNYLLDSYQETGNEKHLAMVQKTLDYMAGIKADEAKREKVSPQEIFQLRVQPITSEWIERVQEINKKLSYPSIYDALEGGFFRYATERNWQKPRFEKMLDDNARLIRIYLRFYELAGGEQYREVALHSLDYVLRTLYDGKLFYGSQEADELYYHMPLELRKKAGAPQVDARSYADRDAEMVMTLFYAGSVLKDEKLQSAARASADAYFQRYSSKRGAMYFYNAQAQKSSIDGLLRANVFAALLGFAAYEHTGEEKYMQKALEFLDFCLEALYDREIGGFYERNSTATEYYPEEELLSTEKHVFTNALAADALLKAYELTGREEYLTAAKKTLALIYTLGLRDSELEHLAIVASSTKQLLKLEAKERKLTPDTVRKILLLCLLSFAALLKIHRMKKPAHQQKSKEERI